ncbi:MAG: thioredoxin-disulfide reductase [Candidatus Shapirobacteria bacterium]|nr:thioredoxin-disulfide reductase [Candidatus Shapirobacteria bacterium]MDD4410173.1 thioredoxin-disulfide reductase [Candidatus Shapirobacteria bacterium]
MDENIKYDCVIIGSGPAGLTAAIYNARADIKTIVIAGNQPGGQLTITPMVDNYPGFPNGVGGFKLMMDIQNQVKNFGVEIKSGLVKSISLSDDQSFKSFNVQLESGEFLETKSVIVATGAAVKWLELPKEKELIGHGISSCATCDGMFFRDKTVAVVGGGDTACEDAVFLSKFTKKVYMIHRREEFRASMAEQKKVLENSKIEILWNSEVKELSGVEKLESVIILNNKTGEEKILELDGLFVAIGYSPATKFLGGLVELRETGQIITGKNEKLATMTNMEGIFAAGDCVNENHRQAIIAAGEGCRAALEAQRWLRD